MNKKLFLIHLLVGLMIMGIAANADEALENLKPNEEIAAFRTEYLYDNGTGTLIGARFRHMPSGMILDVLRIQSVPQAYMWVNTPPPSDKGEPHTCEHLLLGKGNKGRYVASLEDMSLGSSSASTHRLFTNYHFHTTAGADVFYSLLEAKLDALLHPNFSDEEIRREVRNMGIVIDAADSSLSLEEKGTVYTEMVSAFERAGSRLWRTMLVMMHGEGHPLANESGGTPEALRELTPEDMWKFHADCYKLSNMGIIVSIPNEYQLDAFLYELSDMFARLEPDTRPGPDPATLEDRLPDPKPAPLGSFRLIEFPHRNDKEPGYLVFGWPATLKLDLTGRILCDLFLSNLASGETSNLYKRFIDSQSRLMDIGASSVWAGRAYDFGNPIYIGFSDVRQDALREGTIDSVRSIVLEEIRKIGGFEDGSDELAAFNKRITNRIIEQRRETRSFLNRPPRFGYRGTSSQWQDFLKDMQSVDGFRRDLTMGDTFEYLENMMASGKNFWRDQIERWGLVEIEPYTLVTVPNPDLLEQEQVEKSSRIADFVNDLKSKHGVQREEEAIRIYKADYDLKTAEIESKAAEIEMPRFVDDPPMTVDDQLDYRVEELPGGGPVVVSTFEAMTGATVGLSFNMHVIPESHLVYASVLPTLISEVGVIRDGTPISYDDMREMIRREILWVYADMDVNYSTGRVELTVQASGSDRDEASKALEWLQLKLFHPDWRPENLPRIRDAIDLSLQNSRNTMKGSEESWVNGPADAYWRQTDPLILAADCFLTRAHAMQRVRWMLKEAESDAAEAEFSKFMTDLAAAVDKLDRSGLQALLSALSGRADDSPESPVNDDFTARLAGLSDNARALVSDAVQDLRQNLGEVPDATLANDWRYLCAQIATDLVVPPQKVLSDLEYLTNLIRRQDNTRAFVVSSGPVQETVLPALRSIVASLSDEPSERHSYVAEPIVRSRLAERVPGLTDPVYVGLVNENTQNGVFVNYAGCACFKDFDREALLDYLAARLYGGGGAHSMFMKTWSAGLAYSNGLRTSEFSGRLGYYAERCPDLSQTMQFVVDELKNAPYDPRLADYAVAQAFQASRAGSNYEDRGRAMAANLADGITPELVTRFRQAVLDLAKGPDLYDELKETTLYDELRPRMLPVYGRVLPGIDPSGPEVSDALYFIIGPEKQFNSFEEYLHGTEGDATVYRLYPRDFWLVGGAVN